MKIVCLNNKQQQLVIGNNMFVTRIYYNLLNSSKHPIRLTSNI